MNTSSELDRAVGERVTRIAPAREWVIGIPNQSIMLTTWDGFNAFCSRKRAQETLEENRLNFERAYGRKDGQWHEAEVWLNETYPPYSSDLSWAWEVIEALEGEGWNPHMARNFNTHSWTVTFTKRIDGELRERKGFGMDFRKAVCRAALAEPLPIGSRR